MKLHEVLLLIIGIIIMSIQFYILFYVYPIESEIYKRCEIKQLCELNKLDHPICDQYFRTKDIPVINITI